MSGGQQVYVWALLSAYSPPSHSQPFHLSLLLLFLPLPSLPVLPQRTWSSWALRVQEEATDVSAPWL